MARVLSTNDEDPKMVRALVQELRTCDEVLVLPQAHQSSESGAFKNVVCRLAGTEPMPNATILSSNLFSGVSAIRVPEAVAAPLLKDHDARQQTLNALAKAIPSEITSLDISVGPPLDADDDGRDLQAWEAGFDGASCCVGLYSAEEVRAPDGNSVGMQRVHMAYYLVCKAGGGLATQTFHSRLLSALSRGATLDECLLTGTLPGPAALRRASGAATRNRGRLLIRAAQAIGFHTVDSVPDSASPDGCKYRLAIPILNVHTNSLSKYENGGGGAPSVWQYTAGCVDAVASLGIVSASNVANGFVAVCDANARFNVNVRNAYHNCIPFASERVLSNRDAAIRAAHAHKEKKKNAHPDHAWIRDHFAWTDAEVPHGHPSSEFEPVSLWGANAPETFSSAWNRELGLAPCQLIRMRPQLVLVSGNERAKLKAMRQHCNKPGECHV